MTLHTGLCDNRRARERYMILEETEAIERFESPLNLLNRLKSQLSKSSQRSNIVSIPPSSKDIIADLDEKLKFSGLKTKAAGIMSDCLDELKTRVSEIRPERLATVAAEMNKIVTAEADKNKDLQSQPQFVVYSPTFITEDHFDTVYVKE